MIEYIQGNIFDSPAQVIVNTVNTVGVMGKGLALSFKQRYPDMFKKYRVMCEKHQLTVGKLMLCYEPDHWILLFPTKENWRNPSKLEYLEKGLIKFVNTYADKNITSIAFPKLGCGNGELSWDDVRPLMEKYLKPLPIDVYIYLGVIPDSTPEHKTQSATLAWLKENAKDMSFNGVKDDISLATSMLPYTLTTKEVVYDVTLKYDILTFVNQETAEKIVIPEEHFYRIWDLIRRKSVFHITDSSEPDKLVFELLYKFGYLTKIRLLDNKTNIMHDGYQINEGSGRMYSLQEG